jgi:hypothetical protein
MSRDACDNADRKAAATGRGVEKEPIMTHVAFAAGASAQPPVEARYEPGVCNIGPAEIARRRRTGHIGVIVTIVLLGVLIAIDASPLVRLMVALPAMIAASGYLQARLRFCAGFGAAGVYNLGPVGSTESVDDDDARSRDRRRARQIGLASFAIGISVGVVAALLPI